MADVIVKKIDEIDYYQGPNAIPGIRFHGAARALGVTAWGMGVIELEAGCAGYPEHDHAKDGQEEVYVVLAGSATLHSGGQSWDLGPATLVRVGPGEKRKFIAGGEGLTLLAIGATPGKAYEPTWKKPPRST
jgi:mannose-6-phosphate isomerase-like protein (cupin superfamily)